MTPSFHNGHLGPRLLALSLLSAVSVALASGCSARVEVDSKPSRTAAPRPVAAAPSLSAADQAAVNGAWTGFLRLNSIYITAAQTGVYKWDDDATKRPLYAYAGGPYMSALERDLDQMREAGLIRTGTPKVTLRRVVSVSPTSIVVEACVDDTGTDTVARATGKSVIKAGQNQRYPVTMRAGLYPDNRWRWVEARAERSSSC
jgi:hypothetical protein